MTWTEPDDNGATISKYVFQVQSVSTGNWITLDNNVQGLTATHIGINSAVPNTEISYRVYAANAIGQSDASNVAGVWTLPTAPTGVTAVAVSDTEITVSWTTIAGLTYELEHSTSATSGFSTESDPATTPYTDSGLTEGTIHYYRVLAVNPSGTSPESTIVSAITFDAPTQPLNLILTPTLGDLLEITLTWSAPSDDGGTPITNYVVHRSTDSGFLTYDVLQAAGGTETTRSYVDGTLAVSTTYYYRVQAENPVDVGDFSATVQYVSPTLPDAPTNLSGVPYGSSNAIDITDQGAIKLTWTAPSNYGSHPVTGYKIDRSVGVQGAPMGAYVTINSNTGSSSTTAFDSGLDAGDTYQYKIYAITAAGTGTQPTTSNAVTIVNIVASLTLNIVGGNTIEMTPSIFVEQGSGPTAKVELINFSMDGNWVASLQPDNPDLSNGANPFAPRYAYPNTEESHDFYISVTVTQDSAGNHHASDRSDTVSATPDAPFTGDLEWDEFRVEPGSLVASEQDFTLSNLELDIQPYGSNIIVKYTPANPLLDVVVLGFDSVPQNLEEIIATDPNTDYYVGVYISPDFYAHTDHDGSLQGGTGGVLEIDCDEVGTLVQSLGLVCQEDDVPLGAKSNIAFRSLKDPTTPTQLGIEGMGDLFGMPMVMLFVVGIAAVFTGRSAQMGGIILVALISVMIYLGYLPLAWENPTWAIMLIIVGIGIFIGKRLS